MNNVNGNPRMVVAGHCFKLGWNVEAWQAPGTTFGEVKQRDNYPANDLALVGGNGVDHAAKIYVGGPNSTSSAWVESAGTASGVYNIYCKSGASTGEDCGFDLIASGVQYCRADPYGSYGCVTNLQRFEPGVDVQNACIGDSGAPFYRYTGTIYSSDVKIVGMVVGGDVGCDDYTIIEPWSDIQEQYDLTIMTH